MHFLLPLFLAAASFIQSDAGSIPIQLEDAVTPEERIKGLAGRKSLPTDQGMLFHIDPPTEVTIWMYETLIDLSVAFLDETKTIREIHELKAYPEIQDAAFFLKESVKASFKASYVLEMNAHWFRDHGVKVGDRLSF